MKIWIEMCRNFYFNDFRIYFGVGGHKHANKKYKGFTLEIIVFNRMILIHSVSNYKKYKDQFKKVTHRLSQQ